MARSFILIGLILLGAAACSGEPEAGTSGVDADVETGEEAPFYNVDNNGTGPLTMEELQVNLPADLKARLSEKQQACYLEKIEVLAAEAGDPETLKTADVPFLPAQEEWDEFPRFGKRSLLAQALISRAVTLC